ncbi:hypothetical protein NNC19_21310 [Clostridium sp. SHJSY1]|uniref:anti-sigma-I factor RsgI family protein n=1 Tax=Clostridium sp. SHJSY1 TaxID=2942483 RepID=UPI002875F0BF|nr:hypothetical protein [Clostridium sp. SHJSY1]MDS0528229.1 hypothetical protein [Clostridium sp. SHJSY1]
MIKHIEKSKITSIAIAVANEDGKSIFSSVDIENKTLEEAIMEIISQINNQGHFI